MSTPPARPPPIPRRHPSRPSISAAFSYSSGTSSAASPSSDLPPPLPASSSTTTTTTTTTTNSLTPRQSSSFASEVSTPGTSLHSLDSPTADPSPPVWSGLSSSSPPTSPNLHGGRQSMGLGAANVGLGPVLLDFKDWVKAGQASSARDGGGASTIVAGDDDDHHERENGHYNTGIERHDAVPRSSYNSTSPAHSRYSSQPSADYEGNMHDSYTSGYSSTSNTAPSPSAYRPSLPTSISSLSIDSSRSPIQPGRRTSSRMSEREQYRPSSSGTPGRASQDIGREFSSSRASNRQSLHASPLESPGVLGSDSILGSGSHDRSRLENSPLERRFSKRMDMRRNSTIASELVEEESEMVEEEVETIRQPSDGTMSLDERIRDAEMKLARRASLRSGAGTPQRRGSIARASPSPRAAVPSPSVVNGHSSYGHSSDSSRDATFGRTTRVRTSIAGDHQDRSMFTPSPSTGHRMNHLVDLNNSPHSPLTRPESRQESNVSSPRSYRPMVTAAARPHSVLESRDPDPWTRQHYSRGGDLEHFASPRRNFQPRTRPESVLETSADHTRYNGGGGYTSQRMSQHAEERAERSHRLSTLLGSEREYSSRNSFVLGPSRASQDYGKRDSGYSRSSRDFSNRDSQVYSSRDSQSYSNRDSQTYSNRDSQDYSVRSSRDFGSGSRVGISPNDSVSVVGARSEVSTPRQDTARKDPLEMIRRLEESRAQHNRRWEEDRSASVLGDVRSDSRYGEREVIRGEATPLPGHGHGRSSSRLSMVGPRSITSMSTSRDRGEPYTPSAGSRTAPAARRRTDSGSSTHDSPLLGRTNRASLVLSGPSTEPRHRRSQTSFGQRSSQGSSETATATEHGRNLVEAARVLEKRGEVDPEIIAKLGAAASVSERSNAGIRAAVAIAQELVLDVEIGSETAVRTVKDRLPRLAVTLREAGRASDQAVRDLTEALLAVRGESTPARTTHRRQLTLETGSPALSTAYSPLTRRSATSLGHNTEDTPSRALEPIEQSPPKSPRESFQFQSSTLSNHYAPGGEQAPRTPRTPWSVRDSPSLRGGGGEEGSLRKRASLASTGTVRAGSGSGGAFRPAGGEATTALSPAAASGRVGRGGVYVEEREKGEYGDEVVSLARELERVEIERENGHKAGPEIERESKDEHGHQHEHEQEHEHVHEHEHQHQHQHEHQHEHEHAHQAKANHHGHRRSLHSDYPESAYSAADTSLSSGPKRETNHDHNHEQEHDHDHEQQEEDLEHAHEHGKEHEQGHKPGLDHNVMETPPPHAGATSAAAGGEITRTGTFGAVAGSQLRASVSERFRKHLGGE